MPSRFTDVLSAASLFHGPLKRSPSRLPSVCAALTLLALVVTGCTSGDSPDFRINLEGYRLKQPLNLYFPIRYLVLYLIKQDTLMGSVLVNEIQAVRAFSDNIGAG